MKLFLKVIALVPYLGNAYRYQMQNKRGTSFGRDKQNTITDNMTPIPVYQKQHNRSRRQFFQKIPFAISSITSVFAPNANAIDDSTLQLQQIPQTFVRKGKNFSYSLNLPPVFTPGNKPLQTHVDEMLFTTSNVSGYSYGITIDPVRINSISQFGTPEEVAARVVGVEVNRDGVFDVTLNSTADVGHGQYQLDYVSSGKRGIKHLVNRVGVDSGMLYVLTVSCKDKDWAVYKDEIESVVKTFSISINEVM
mmetsp:Transcript_41975/g.50360  ORF Transcript_41975/g.50360 Transcript_41975/m.50360 type:complete len:250 (+) Transcript_41975:59-808(+)